MKLSKRVKTWVDAGLIDDAAAARILAHEESRQGLSFVHGLLGLGALAILLGIAAIIGVNWDVIPPFVKLGVHTLLNIGVAAALHYAFQRKAPYILIELLAAALAGLTFTFIALTGQIYQSQEPIWKALALWFVLISPYIVVLARSQRLISLWVAGFLVTYGFFLGDVPQVRGELTNILLYSLLPFGMIAVGQSKLLRSRFDAIMTNLSYTGFVIIAVEVSFSQLVWRHIGDINAIHNDTAMQAFTVTIAAALAIMAGRRMGAFVPVVSAVDLFLPLSVVFGFLPDLVSHGDWKVAGAAAMMIYWGFCGWVGMKAGYRRAVDAAITLIALRLVIVYVEVFGTLLNTGIGLIVSGALLIGLVIGTRKLLVHMKEMP